MKQVKKTLAFLLVFAFQPFAAVWAEVPTAEAADGGEVVQDGFWAWFTAWLEQIVLYGVPAVLAIIMLWFLWELAAKVNEQRNSKQPEWGGVIAFSLATAGYFIVALGIAALILNMFA